MKKILLIFLLLAAVFAKGQTTVYHPFPDSDAVWCCEWGNPCGSCENNWASYILNGKILINSITYNVMVGYATGYSCSDLLSCMGCTCNSGSSSYNDTVVYYVRQDSILRKVWILDTIAHTETILYDFNLHVGDTLNRSKVYWGSNSSQYIITSIDSILLNGQFRRRYNYPLICFASDSSAIIEGIGSLSGLFSGPSCFEYIAVLNQFIQNNHVVIGDSLNLQCVNFSLNIDKIAEQKLITLSPNPFHTTATFEIKNEELRMKNLEMKIYNAIGRLVRAITLEKNRGEAIIPRGDLSDGLYFYQLVSEDGETVAGKFEVE